MKTEFDPATAVAAVQKISAVPTILDVVCRLTGMGFAAVARVTERQWIACTVKDDLGFGLKPGGELKLETTICHEIRQHRKAVVIDDVQADEHWSQHHTPAMYGLRSYISMPIVLPDGEFFGTLCAIDPKVAQVSAPEVVNTFTLFAELIAFHLDAQRRVAVSEAALLDERETARLREQFIAVLGHDLRNPLSSISGAAHVLQKVPLDPPVRSIVNTMQRSVRRMATLIDDLMDFARGRLGSGLKLSRTRELLAPVLEQVVSELGIAIPDRRVDAQFDLPEPVNCDRARLAQLFSNLLANAISYGAPDQAVRARASMEAGELHLFVANAGEPISPAAMARLFSPFSRGEINPSSEGLGLGLYIAHEIARAHGGTLTASSTPEETRFTLRMPV